MLVEIGSRLREHRKAAGHTQEDLAFRVGLNPRFLGCVERGEKHIATARLLMVLASLNVEPADFFANFPTKLVRLPED